MLISAYCKAWDRWADLVLKVALSSLIADGAIQRVVDLKYRNCLLSANSEQSLANKCKVTHRQSAAALLDRIGSS